MVLALEDLGPAQFVVFNWTLWTLAFVIVVLRLAVRYRTTSRLYWDDAFAVSGIIWLTTMVIMNHFARDGIYLQIDLAATGRPSNPKFTSKQLISDAMIGQKKMQFAFMMAFWNSLWSAKASLMMFYRRLFNGVDGYMRWWWAVTAMCILMWLISILTDFMVCLPLRRRFSLAPEDRCNPKAGANSVWVATALDIATDVMVAVLPISLLVGLRMSLKKKIAIGAIFALGAVVIFFSVFRMVKVLEAIGAESPKILLSLALWSMLEAAVAVIVGSLPTLKALISRKGQSDYTGQKSNGGTYGAKGPSVRLYNMESQIHNKIRGGYGSDEEALNNKRGGSGITKTQEVSVSSEDFSERKGADSPEYVHRAEKRGVAV